MIHSHELITQEEQLTYKYLVSILSMCLLVPMLQLALVDTGFPIWVAPTAEGGD